MKTGFKTIGLWATLVVAVFAVAALTLVSGCGDKIALPSDLPKPDPNNPGIDTTYVLVNPIWTGAGGISFNRPYDVVVGYDQYIYVCDTKNNRVVKMSEDGTFIESDSAINPVAVTQDRGLDLLMVAGDFVVTRPDTTYAGTDSMRIAQDSTVYGNAIYRKRHFGGGGFENVWQADSPYWPIYVPTTGDTIWQEAQFWGIAASNETDKQYFLADFLRSRILRFGSDDKAIPPALDTEGVGVGMTMYPMDLYFYTIAGKNYLAFAQGYGNFGAQVVSPINGASLFTNTEDGLPPMVRLSSRGPKQIAVDEFSNFYVLLEKTDPVLGTRHLLYKYDRNGQPLLSFGTEGSGERQFRNPRGLAYLNGIIYIADTGNNRIVRYQLATDIQQ